MPLPTTRVVTGRYTNPVTGVPCTGCVILTPSPGVWTDETGAQVLTGGATLPLVDGVIAQALVTTDASGVEPATGRLWVIEERIDGRPYRRRPFALEAGVDSIDVTELVDPDPADVGYVRGPAGPTGPAGSAGAPGTPGADGSDGAPGAPGAPGAKGDTGDQGPQGIQGVQGNAGTAGTAGAAGPQGAMGASGTVITMAQANITDGTVTDLPSSTPWIIVQTSAGTPLQCSIPAAVGDRIDVDLGMMYNGGHFMDIALLTSAGAISIYGSSNTSSPLSEGAPWLYPSVSFSKIMSEMFTVQAGHIDGSGTVTIALVHSGTSTGRVYANTQYPWGMRLWNFGPVGGSAAGSWLPRPADQGLLTWTGDPNDAGHVTAQSSAGVAGRITLVKVPIREQITWSSIWIGLSGIDAAASLSNCYLGVYDSSGTLKGVTADISSSLMTGATAKALPLAVPFVAAPGHYYIAMLLGSGSTWATNGLTFKATGAGISVNANLAAGALRYSNMLTGQTSLPGSLTLSSQTTTIINTGWGSQWYGIS
ncbi:hypothetical protein ACODT5_15655 [Streptomyces sp. 5.8]|uniref:hypothetical protein n=1 Tax=Streptomyces sp. 5.8 TaxID=3406571 RepID=UPI003BB5B9EF